MQHRADPATYLRAAAGAMEALEAGIAQNVGAAYALADAATAQADLEAGKTTGCSVLIP
jgi:NADPH2:quinone reductase